MSAYGWSQRREKPPDPQAEKIPPGTHEIWIKDVKRDNRTGKLFQSRDGTPAMLVILTDHQAREVAQWVTLNDVGIWWLQEAVLASDRPDLLKSWEDRGVEPRHFENEDFAKTELGDVRFTAVVTVAKNPKYMDIRPIRGTAPRPTADEEPPPPEPEAEPAPASSNEEWTEKRAWQACLDGWADHKDEAPKRNALWHETVRAIAQGRPKDQLASAEWQEVARVSSKVSVPF